LYFRPGAFIITAPPLRERRDDIPPRCTASWSERGAHEPLNQPRHAPAKDEAMRDFRLSNGFLSETRLPNAAGCPNPASGHNTLK